MALTHDPLLASFTTPFRPVSFAALLAALFSVSSLTLSMSPSLALNTLVSIFR